jgi:phosphocarrier protein HPr
MALLRTVTIRNRLGLHARPAALFVQVSSRYSCEVWVERDKLRVNGKSIMGIMMLAAEQGVELRIEAEGDDAQACLDALTTLIESGFQED